MKDLSRLLLVMLVIMMSFQAYAQIGVRAGLNMANALIKDDTETYSDNYTMNPGFHVGVVYEISFAGVIAFEPGLILSTKGFKNEESDAGYTGTEKANLIYLDIPLNVKISTGPVYFTAGPYVGIGLSGTYELTLNGPGIDESMSEDINWGTDELEDDLKRPDMGLSVGAGVQFLGANVGLSYDYGVANISPDSEGGFKINNRILKVSVGYTF